MAIKMNKVKKYENREACEGWECITLSKKFNATVYKNEDKIAVIDDEGSLTYSELRNTALSISHFFLNKGLRKNDTVIVHMPNKILFLSLFYGLMEIGVVPILLLPSHREAVLNGIFELAQPKAYISVSQTPDMDFVPMAKAIATHYNCKDMLFFDFDLEQIMDKQFNEEIVCEKPDYRDVAIMTLSGGTTGIPKLIPRTHGDYIYNSKMSAKRCGWNNDTVFLAGVPVAHNFALGCPGIIGTIMSGGTSVLTIYTSPVDIFDYIEVHRVTAVCMVPTLVNVCVEYRSNDNSSDISSLQYLLVGGSTFMPADAVKAKKIFDCVLIQVYGMAEGLICTTLPDDPEDVIFNTQGQPCSPYDEILIVDENGCQVPDGTSGEVITRGPYTISAYYRLPETQMTCFTKDGWYRPGDKGVITKEGNIQILGRVKEMINRAGEKIVPVMLEERICTHENVNTCSVVGVPDKLLGNRICIFMVMEKNRCLKLNDIKDYLRNQGVAEYALPDQLLIIKDLPLTAVGKINKNRLIDIAREAATDAQEVQLYE